MGIIRDDKRKKEARETLETGRKLLTILIEQEEGHNMKKTKTEQEETPSMHNAKKDRAYYQQTIENIKALQRKELRSRITVLAGSVVIFLVMIYALATWEDNPSSDGHVPVSILNPFFPLQRTNPKNTTEAEIELDFEVYRFDYMTKDYVLMGEEKLDGCYRMEYYKNPQQYVIIEQSSTKQEKELSIPDSSKYQTILYFVKGDTSILIKSTLGEEEIHRIAEGLYPSAG